jgi:SNF2 family DNA or RNA helicase
MTRIFIYLFVSFPNIVHASLRENVVLKPHQVEGIDKMIFMEKAYRGGILADEVSQLKKVGSPLYRY